MNATAKTLIAATLSLAGLSAFAQFGNPIPPTWANEQMGPLVHSATTRAEVEADVKAAVADGRINRFDPLGENGPAPVTTLAKVKSGAANVARIQESTLTREQVRAAVLEARRNGQLNPFENMDGITYRPAVRYSVAPASLAQGR